MSKSIIEIYKAKLRDAYLKIADLEAKVRGRTCPLI